ncbi:MAG: MBL fold metallo-hydrolase [Roseiarcus sp.]
MRIHHLNCGSLCPRGGRFFGGEGGPLSTAPMCCHCLLIEGEDGLTLVDSGLGLEDVADPKRLGFLFNALTRPKLSVEETAARRIEALGFHARDVRHIVPTHLDLDHAGGFGDFPEAKIHVFAPELRAALKPTNPRERMRYRPAQLAGVSNWAPVETQGERWFGFTGVRALPGSRDDVLLIPLPGHTSGHCGVAVNAGDGWLLHCGDAYFHASEVAPEGGATPIGLRAYGALMSVEGDKRRANRDRLRALARDHAGEVKLMCSHDPAELAAYRS